MTEWGTQPKVHGTVAVGQGPCSQPHIITTALPLTPGRPYPKPVRTVCQRRLSRLLSIRWIHPDDARKTLTCTTCLSHLQEINNAKRI